MSQEHGVDSHVGILLQQEPTTSSSLGEAIIDDALRMALEITSSRECLDVVEMASDDHKERVVLREAHRRDVLKDDMALFYRELIKVQTRTRSSSSHLMLEEVHDLHHHDDVSDDRKNVSI